MTRRWKLASAMAGLVLLAGLVTGCGHARPGANPQGPVTLDAAVSACRPSVTAWPVSQRVEQLLMVAGQFSDLSASTPMASAGVGGLVLFGQPAAGSGPTISSGIGSLDASARAHGQIVPWMSTDEEGGPIARLAQVIGPLPSPRQMAAGWTPAQVQSAMTSHGSAMASLGVTMDLAPVLDTASPGDTVAGESYRSFSENGGVAASYGLAYARGLRAGGVVPVAKHFPGLGHASADTDNGPATDPPLSQLETDDLIPFEQAALGQLPVVMVGHPMVPGLTGSVPASLSPAAYQFLRTQVGFGGVAMTDDLDAGAISAAGYTQAAAAVRAIESGADMAMIDAGQWSATVSALLHAVSSGALPMARVDAAATRILAAKGIPACSAVTWAPGTHGFLQELFAVSASGQAQTNWQQANGTWAGWHSLGGANLLGGVTWAPGTHGFLQELFAVSASGQAQTNWQQANGTWAGWHSLGGANLLGGVTWAPGTHGFLQELFAVSASGQAQTNWQQANGTWAGWHSLGGANLLGGVTWAPGTHGFLQELFAVSASGQAQTNWQQANGTWAGWHSLGGANLLGGVTWAPGTHGFLQELFAVSASGQAQTNWQQANGTWAGWHSLGGANLLGGVTWAPGTHGFLQELFAVSASGQAQTNWQQANGTWAGWHSLGGANLLGGVTWAPGTHGFLQELFAVSASGQAQTNWQQANGTWAGWHALGFL